MKPRKIEILNKHIALYCPEAWYFKKEAYFFWKWKLIFGGGWQKISRKEKISDYFIIKKG
jgi:hypothetical protein